jgi:hypothetical protein
VRDGVPRYIVERTFAEGARIAPSADERQAIVDRNGDHGVTWVHSFVADGSAKSFCVVDAPGPEAIRKAAARNALPVDRITRVTVLDPYPYRSETDGGVV